MDKLAEALIKLVEQGTPAASQIALWYFVYRTVGNLIIVGGVTTTVLIITRCIQRANDQEHERRMRQDK